MRETGHENVYEQKLSTIALGIKRLLLDRGPQDYWDVGGTQPQNFPSFLGVGQKGYQNMMIGDLRKVKMICFMVVSNTE